MHDSLRFSFHSIPFHFLLIFYVLLTDDKSPAATFMLITKVNWLTLATLHVHAYADANKCNKNITHIIILASINADQWLVDLYNLVIDK